MTHPVVGDIFVNSWGYDQTNVNYYQVVRVSKASVWIREIGSEAVAGSSGEMSCRVMPVKGAFVNDDASVTKRIREGYDGEPRVNFGYGSGSRFTGESNYCSWYA